MNGAIVPLQAANGGIVMANYVDSYINDDPLEASVWDVVSKCRAGWQFNRLGLSLGPVFGPV